MVNIYLLGNSTAMQMFGFVIKTDNNTVIIDGGSAGDCLQLQNFISEKCNNKVDAWFFTHPHHDHIGAFCELNRKDISLRIKKIYHCFPDLNDLLKNESRAENEIEIWKDTKRFFENRFYNKVCRLKKSDCFLFDEVKFKVLRTFNEKINTNYINNSSAVFRIETTVGSFLILGDLGVEGGNELMSDCSLVDLQTDYTQMAHHGQCGVSKEFYDYIKPKKCIWPTPKWLWDNDNGGGINSGPWQTLKTRQWMEDLGVN